MNTLDTIVPLKEWHDANTLRTALYRWFADIFALELTTETIADWRYNNVYNQMHDIFSRLGLESSSSRVQAALSTLDKLSLKDCQLELAADFAQIFLLSGNDSAPPYASYYLDEDKRLYAKPAQQMRKYLNSRQLSLHPDFSEPDDHISVYLQVMTLWASSNMHENSDTQNNQRQNQLLDMQTTAQEQVDFLDTALLTWLPQFTSRCQMIKVTTDFYPALTTLLCEFVCADREAIADVAEPTHS